MTHLHTLSEIARVLGGAYGQDHVTQGEDGPVCVGFDEIDVVFMALPNPEKFLIVAGLGDLPATEAERLALCERLLQANTCFIATGGFTLSKVEGPGVLLQGKIAFSELSHERDVVALLENFLDVANYWKSQFGLQTPNDRDPTLQKEVASLLDQGLRA